MLATHPATATRPATRSYATSCATCDNAARAGATPGSIYETVYRADGTREVHRIPDPALNDAFYPGSRSFRAR